MLADPVERIAADTAFANFDFGMVRPQSDSSEDAEVHAAQERLQELAEAEADTQDLNLRPACEPWRRARRGRLRRGIGRVPIVRWFNEASRASEKHPTLPSGTWGQGSSRAHEGMPR